MINYVCTYVVLLRWSEAKVVAAKRACCCGIGDEWGRVSASVYFKTSGIELRLVIFPQARTEMRIQHFPKPVICGVTQLSSKMRDYFCIASSHLGVF